MKKAYLPAFLLGLMTLSSNVQAQDCPQGDANTPKTYSLYKEYFKQGNLEKALPYWKEIYENAPGFRKATFVDGTDIYTELITKTEDAALKEKYIDTLLAIYDKRIQCWGDKGYVLQLKGIDIARFRPNQYAVAKKVLEEAINLDQINSKYYGVATYFNLLVNLKDVEPGVDQAFIQKEYNKLVAISDANIQAGNNADAFSQVKAEMSYNLKKFVLPQRFAEGADWYTWSVETKTDSVKSWVEQDPSVSNLEDILSNISKDANLKNSEIRNEVEKTLLEKAPTAARANNVGAYYYDLKKFDLAIPYFEKSIELTTDTADKANILLALGDTYRQLEKFEEAREAAKKAIELDTTSAKPYYLIGVLYLSSGKKCGPGTGFDSQRVIWPAFDYFEKAKQLDESFAAIVDPLIKDYTKYLPTRSEVNAKGLKVGATYTVPCWINEETTVRTKD